MRLTIYFDGQYWVGVAENTDFDPPLVARHIFGAEPQDVEVMGFVNGRMFALLAEAALRVRTGEALLASPGAPVSRSPKRRAREAAAAVREHGVSTRAQLALQQHYEAHKQERRAEARIQREAELDRRWERKRQRAKARHRGH